MCSRSSGGQESLPKMRNTTRRAMAPAAVLCLWPWTAGMVGAHRRWAGYFACPAVAGAAGSYSAPPHSAPLSSPIALLETR